MGAGESARRAPGARGRAGTAPARQRTNAKERGREKNSDWLPQLRERRAAEHPTKRQNGVVHKTRAAGSQPQGRTALRDALLALRTAVLLDAERDPLRSPPPAEIFDAGVGLGVQERLEGDGVESESE